MWQTYREVDVRKRNICFDKTNSFPFTFVHYYNKESLLRITCDSKIAEVLRLQKITNNSYIPHRIHILNKRTKGSKTCHFTKEIIKILFRIYQKSFLRNWIHHTATNTRISSFFLMCFYCCFFIYRNLKIILIKAARHKSVRAIWFYTFEFL